MTNEQIVAILKQLVTYFLEIFKYFGYITQEDIDGMNEFIGSFTDAE